MSEELPVRLQKVIARSGVASRREAERLILSGLVCVNGRCVRELGTKVFAADVVLVNGVELKPTDLLYLALNKPRGYECSNDPSSNFPSFLSLLPKDRRTVHHVGRLDVASEGLLLATTDGALTQIVTHPSFEVPKLYDVWVRGQVDDVVLRACVEGRRIDGEWLRFEEMDCVENVGDRSLVRVKLHGGKNREIRRLIESFGMGVARLKRQQIGSVQLGDLATGKWRVLTAEEVDSLFGYRTSGSRTG